MFSEALPFTRHLTSINLNFQPDRQFPVLLHYYRGVNTKIIVYSTKYIRECLICGTPSVVNSWSKGATHVVARFDIERMKHPELEKTDRLHRSCSPGRPDPSSGAHNRPVSSGGRV